VHLHLPHLPVPAILLSVVQVAAISVALAAPGQHTLAGLVVLTGLVGRWTLWHHRRTAAVVDAEPAVAPA
jgi:uncharacterized membrane protein